jgi:hypothetical protein
MARRKATAARTKRPGWMSKEKLKGMLDRVRQDGYAEGVRAAENERRGTWTDDQRKALGALTDITRAFSQACDAVARVFTSNNGHM